MSLTYRHPTIDDLPKLNEWVAADPDHNGKCDGSFFVLLPDKDGKVPRGIQCIEVLDEQGTVFFLKFTNALIVDAQFPPNVDADQKIRIAKALKDAFVYFSVSSKGLGYHELLFESISMSLTSFFSRLGFRKAADFFRVNL